MKEWLIERFIWLCGVSAIFFVFAIFIFVFREGADYFFSGFKAGEFFTSIEWYPTLRTHVRYLAPWP